MSRLRVGVVFGGQSGEHEVSLASAEAVLGALDPARFEPVPIGISREGHWLTSDRAERLLVAEVIPELPGTHHALPEPSQHAIVRGDDNLGGPLHGSGVDVVFPVLHGPQGEDGSIQGLVQLLGLPCVGSGILGSALGMDKAKMKAIFAQAGLQNVPYFELTVPEWRKSRDNILGAIESALQYPLFVKPCNMGSSVGISKVQTRTELANGIDDATRFDRRVIIEQGIDAREVECGVLGNDDPQVSVPGEIVPRHEFYDYEAKYTEGLADLLIPAPLTAEQTDTVQSLARRAFVAVDAAGLARVDFFVERTTGEVLINEINTIPGFTSTSMYPKLWEASGVPYRELVSRLIDLALERHDEMAGYSLHR